MPICAVQFSAERVIGGGDSGCAGVAPKNVKNPIITHPTRRLTRPLKPAIWPIGKKTDAVALLSVSKMISTNASGEDFRTLLLIAKLLDLERQLRSRP